MDNDFLLNNIKSPRSRKIGIISGLLAFVVILASGFAIAFTMSSTKAPTTPVTSYHLEDDYVSLDIAVSYDEQKYTLDYTNKTEYHMYGNHVQNTGSFDETTYHDGNNPDGEINGDDMDKGGTHSNSNVDISISDYYRGEDSNRGNNYFVDLNNNGFLDEDEGEYIYHSHMLTINGDVDEILYNNEIVPPVSN